MKGVSIGRLAIAIAKRPHLWVAALSASRSLARKNWWLMPPFLPVPDPDWLSFRLVTAYGTDESSSDPIVRNQRVADVLTWLEWRRQFAQATRR